ncbi:MAG TPA: glycosyltransferase, partial [Polyangiaceae bacterium]|nr:glycosyltransferase [Polyangiaceae bacterium]
MERVCVVIPAYNDWESVQRLLVDLSVVGAEHGLRYRIILVDDSSTIGAPEAWQGILDSAIDCLKIVRLACNLGHQRAIAVGLVISRDELESCTAVVVMDGDGEDRPRDIPRLLASSSAHPGSIVCARRARRSEPFVFRALYKLYKLLFGSLTGTLIDFGNFCLIPKAALRAVVSQAGIWNHLAATLTRSRVPLVKIDTARGERYAGQSKMNFVSLVVHGLTAVAVYADVALVRIVILAMVLAACAFGGIIATAGVRLATPYAIPGWASGV